MRVLGRRTGDVTMRRKCSLPWPMEVRELASYSSGTQQCTSVTSAAFITGDTVKSDAPRTRSRLFAVFIRQFPSDHIAAVITNSSFSEQRFALDSFPVFIPQRPASVRRLTVLNAWRGARKGDSVRQCLARRSSGSRRQKSQATLGRAGRGQKPG